MTNNYITIEPFNKNPYPRIGYVMRRKHLFTMQKLAEKFEGYPRMSEKSLKRYEAGTANCPASVLKVLADFYECGLEELYDDDVFSDIFIFPEKKVFRYTPYIYKLTQQGPALLKNNKFKGYRTDSGLDFKKGYFDIVELKSADQSLGLPKGTKIIFNYSDFMNYELNEEEKIYLVELGPKEITNFPETHRKMLNKRERLLFITKAKVLPNTYQPKMVLYYYNNEIKNVNYQMFGRRIKGIARKIIIDY
jgi:hypothetical protein